MVHLGIHQKLERSPHYRQIVVDPHEGIVNSLLSPLVDIQSGD